MIETEEVQTGGGSWGGWFQLPFLFDPRRTSRFE